MRQPDPDIPLTPTGLARRDAILHDALRHARCRAMRRRALPVVLLIMLLALTLVALRDRSSSESSIVRHTAPIDVASPERVPADPPAFRVRVAGASPMEGVVQIARPSAGRVVVVNEQTLLAELARVGAPAGIVEADGRAWVVFHHNPPSIDPRR
ncbi:MAG TPA: hypothetical protein PKB10_04820 [Tepidisphaeraceae bacterium]|nr:hypothetical protein [Tepidisphaeraceae bacterium]